MFVTFEGIGGAGKTTQSEAVSRWLSTLGVTVVLTREPGGTELGEELRRLLLNGEVAVELRAQAALFAAARAQLVEEVIRPALQRRAIVICDRYMDSSIVYQGAIAGLGEDAVLQLNLFATGGCVPDLTFVLLVDPKLAEERRTKRDPVEPNDRNRRRKLHRAYRRLVKRFPERVVLVDASKPASDVFEVLRGELTRRLLARDDIAEEIRDSLRARS